MPIFCTLECGELGIVDDNRSINDTAFLASSYKTGFEPYRARLNGFNAWCARVNDQNQYLEIDFGKHDAQFNDLSFTKVHRSAGIETKDWFNVVKPWANYETLLRKHCFLSMFCHVSYHRQTRKHFLRNIITNFKVLFMFEL